MLDTYKKWYGRGRNCLYLRITMCTIFWHSLECDTPIKKIYDF